MGLTVGATTVIIDAIIAIDISHHPQPWVFSVM